MLLWEVSAGVRRARADECGDPESKVLSDIFPFSCGVFHWVRKLWVDVDVHMGHGISGTTNQEGHYENMIIIVVWGFLGRFWSVILRWKFVLRFVTLQIDVQN